MYKLALFLSSSDAATERPPPKELDLDNLGCPEAYYCYIYNPPLPW
jgi:hypothetical protein